MTIHPIGRPEATAMPHPGLFATLRWWSLIAAVMVGAMVPWYTLRLFPVLEVGTAKVNFLDALVAVAVLLALPRIVQGVRRGEPAVLCVLAFMAAMIVPFLVGLRDPDSAFFAIREARPLAFYAIALAFATGGYGAKDFRAFATAYAIGAVAAVIVVFAHVYWGAPLSGYEDKPLPPDLGHAPLVQYLAWPTAVVALLLSLQCALASRSAGGRVAWIGALIPIAWYVLASAERFAQVLAASMMGIMVVLPARGGRVFRLRPSLGLVLVIIAALGLLSTGGRIGAWTRYSALRWYGVLHDGSLEYRMRETVAGLSITARHPFFGGGLGGTIPIPDPYVWWFIGHGQGNQAPAKFLKPWRYLSTGYGFLLVRTGIVGLGVYLTMFGVAFRRARHQWYARADTAGWPRVTIGVVGLVTLLVANLLQPVVDIPEAVIAFGLFYGMIVSVPTFSAAPKNTREAARPEVTGRYHSCPESHSSRGLSTTLTQSEPSVTQETSSQRRNDLI